MRLPVLSVSVSPPRGDIPPSLPPSLPPSSPSTPSSSPPLSLFRFFLPPSLPPSLFFLLLSSNVRGTPATSCLTRERARAGGRERWLVLSYHCCRQECRK